MKARGSAKKITLALAGLLLAGYMAYLFMGQWLLLKDLNAQKATLQTQQAQLEKQGDELKQDIEFSKTDSFVERMARELLGWVKPGEIKIAQKN